VRRGLRQQFAAAEALHKEGKFAEAIAALGDEIGDDARALVHRSRCRATAAIHPSMRACCCVFALPGRRAALRAACAV